MTESEFRPGLRPWPSGRPSDDLRSRLELVDEAMLAIAGNVAVGRAPSDEAERERCRLVAERIERKGRRIVDLLASPPQGRAAGRPGGTIDHPDHREQGEEP